MTRRKKRTYFAVMLVSGAAMLVDRYLLPGGSAPAAVQAHGLSSPGVSSEPARTAEQTPIPELPFPDHFPEVSASDLSRDFFALPAGVDGLSLRTSSGEDTAVQVPGNPARPAADTFSQRHRLDAILTAKGLRIAVIDGVWMREGQELDACRLVRIENTEARFWCDGREIVLGVVAGQLDGGR